MTDGCAKWFVVPENCRQSLSTHPLSISRRLPGFLVRGSEETGRLGEPPYRCSTQQHSQHGQNQDHSLRTKACGQQRHQQTRQGGERLSRKVITPTVFPKSLAGITRWRMLRM